MTLRLHRPSVDMLRIQRFEIQALQRIEIDRRDLRTIRHGSVSETLYPTRFTELMCYRFTIKSILREVVFTFQELELRTRRERQNGAKGLTARAITRHAPINIHVDLVSHGTALAPTFVVLFHLLSPQVSVYQPPSKDDAPLKPRVNSGMY